MKYSTLFPAVFLAASASFAHAIPLFTPDDPIIAIGEIDGTSESNYPAAEAPSAALDTNPGTKYLNFGKENSGFIITPASGASTATSIVLVTANDAPERDPASYELYGTNEAISSFDDSLGDGETWTLIQDGTLDLPTGRGESEAISLTNSTAYTSYKLKFPTIKNTEPADSMQIADVVLYAGNDAITAPGDTIFAIDSDVAGFTSSYPTTEYPANAIDGTLSKYLNFGGANTGFIVTPSVGKSRLESFAITTANDFESRDPVHVKIYGTDDPITSAENSAGDAENWTFIWEASLTPPTERHTLGSEVLLETDEQATSYKVVFSHLRGGDLEIMQIAEIAFEGSVIPPNDRFEDRIDLGSTTPQTVTGTNRFATTDVREHSNGVWWTWTAPAAGKYEIDTSGSSFNTILIVGTGDNLADFSQVPQISNGSDSRVAFQAEAGTSYHIQVAGSQQGDIVLNIAEGMPPANDDLANAEQLDLNGNSAGRIDFASTENGEPEVDNIDRSMWWQYTHSGEASDVYVEIPGRWFNLRGYEGESIESLSLLTAANHRIGGGVRMHWRAEEGVTYRIRVGSQYGGDFEIALREAQEPTNDDFSNAAVLDGVGPWLQTIDNGLATFEPGEPSTLYGDRETLWWKWVAPESRTYGATGQGHFSNVSTYTGSSLETLTLVARSGSEGHTFDAIAGETYYFQACGEWGTRGPIKLFVGTATRPAYEAWLAAQTPALPVGLEGVNDDPDSDGYTNSEEFAFGLDPNQPSRGDANAPVFEYDYDEYVLRVQISLENVEHNGSSSVSLIGESSNDGKVWLRYYSQGEYPTRELQIDPANDFSGRSFYRFRVNIAPNFTGDIPE